MNVYVANEGERDILRAVFGPAVASVTFWDADDASEFDDDATTPWWSHVDAFDAAGALVGRVDPSDPADASNWECLAEVPGPRCQSVKFGLVFEV